MINDLGIRRMLLLGAAMVGIGSTLVGMGYTLQGEGWLAIGSFLASIAIYVRMSNT